MQIYQSTSINFRERFKIGNPNLKKIVAGAGASLVGGATLASGAALLGGNSVDTFAAANGSKEALESTRFNLTTPPNNADLAPQSIMVPGGLSVYAGYLSDLAFGESITGSEKDEKSEKTNNRKLPS